MGGKDLAKSLKKQVKESGLKDTVSIKKCACLGMCQQAPAIKLKKGKLKRNKAYPAEAAKLLAEFSLKANKKLMPVNELMPVPPAKSMFENKAV